ncbi:MAG: DNA-binding protein Alba [Halobacteria archaeon]|nr:DNA-binding protein Alba [Halobacteria archaeon]
MSGDSTESETDEEQTDDQETEQVDENSDIVFVGSKPPMKYVQATMTAFNEGNERVVLKARGRAISTAVDTAEILRREFMENVDIQDIEITTEEIQDDEGEMIKLSSIRITMGEDEEEE